MKLSWGKDSDLLRHLIAYYYEGSRDIDKPVRRPEPHLISLQLSTTDQKWGTLKLVFMGDW